MLGELGIAMESNLMKQLDSLEKNGLAFFHAPFFHNLVGEVREVRQRLGIRTVFNVLGPLLHPQYKTKIPISRFISRARDAPLWPKHYSF